MKDFDGWNTLKKNIDKQEKIIFCNTREIWWCSIGMNIGTELYGKNELFERPVLVLKVFNKETIKVVPLTTKEKDGNYYASVTLRDTTSYAVFTHVRTISTKRLSRKVGRISKDQFKEIIQKYKDSL
ncbi:MAG TPA: type II toxin-antitoxin system PemK/MazF family toxin [Candidatus Paceibacterota bacterium]|jgi:mRNA-degrading endonuclease toxin of MazEF toxin-antitoxin module|nr:type II toxin-antitoxin system PemK/MazF family toxin [Candidatus Paceibacterota bacterium]